MKFIDLEILRAHCRADSTDDDLLTLYANAAEAACVRFCGRSIFPTQEEMDEVVDAAPSAAQAAKIEHEQAVTDAQIISDPDTRKFSIVIADKKYHDKISAIGADLRGMVAGDDFRQAVYLTAGHYYRNREDVVAGQNAAVNELPKGASWNLQSYYYYGD